jgi:transposase-like protein
VDVDSGELLALETSYGKKYLDSLTFLRKVLKMCTNKPLVVVDRGLWHRWTLRNLDWNMGIRGSV